MNENENPLVFLDLEATGLDRDHHDVWEVAYAYETGPVTSMIVPHTLDGADPDAMRINRYHDRFPHGAQPDPDADDRLRAALSGATVVAANPAYDTSMLHARWGQAPWHYRLVNISDVAMTVFGWSRPRGMAAVADECRSHGFHIPAPDHSAATDVASLRACWFALWELRGPAVSEARTKGDEGLPTPTKRHG